MKKGTKIKTADIKLEQDITKDYSDEFVSRIKLLIEKDIKRFNLDLGSVNMIDTYGLSNLIIFCDKPDLEFTFKNINPPLKHILNNLKIDKLVNIE